jgi:hypothetical protein
VFQILLPDRNVGDITARCAATDRITSSSVAWRAQATGRVMPFGNIAFLDTLAVLSRSAIFLGFANPF